MKKKLMFLILGSIIIVGGGLGTYFYLNPLGDGYEIHTPGTIISDGQLVDADSSHKGSGTVQIVQVEANEIELQFLEVEITNGPDLFVYLSKKPSYSDPYDSIGEFIDLGKLTYNSGNFSYAVPSSVQLEDYNSVVIYCKQYSVVFTYAKLE